MVHLVPIPQSAVITGDLLWRHADFIKVKGARPDCNKGKLRWVWSSHLLRVTASQNGLRNEPSPDILHCRCTTNVYYLPHLHSFFLHDLEKAFVETDISVTKPLWYQEILNLHVFAFRHTSTSNSQSKKKSSRRLTLRSEERTSCGS